MAVAGAYAANRESAGQLRSVFFISEGWMSRNDEQAPPELPPSKDPNRLEVLIISGVNVPTRQTTMVIFEMVRDENGVLGELRDFPAAREGETNAESPLLDVFVLGYLSIAP